MAYIGRGLDNGVRNRFIFAATQGQKIFTGSDLDGKTLTISDALYCDVYHNGVKIKLTTDWSSSTTTMTLVTGASVNDVIEIISFEVFGIPDTVSASSGGNFNGGIGATTGTFSGALSATTGTFSSNGTFAGTIKSSVNGTNANLILDNDADTPYLRFDESSAAKFTIGESSIVGGGDGYYDFYAVAGIGQRFFTGAGERLTIGALGHIYAKSSDTSLASLTLRKGVSGADSIDYIQARNDNNDAKFIVEGDGDVKNTNNSYGAVSDQKLKENIVDATNKLEDLKQVQVRNYNLIGSDKKHIGVVAQELETIFPALISESIDRNEDGEDLGTTTKSVKYSVFVPMLIKAMQEQQATIEALEARITALET